MQKIKIFLLSLIVISSLLLNSSAQAARTDGFWDSAGTYLKTTSVLGYDILINGVNKYINFNTISGIAGYGFRDNGGTMQWKNSGGSWQNIGTGGGGGSSTPTTINGASGPDFTFTSSNDTNVGLTISTSTSAVDYALNWIGTLANSRIASSSYWKGYIDYASDAIGLTYNNLTGHYSWTAGYEGFKTASGTAFQNTTNLVSSSSASWDAKQNALTFPLSTNLGGTGSTSLVLDTLGDVNVSAPVTNDVLSFNGANWFNSPLGSVSVSGLTDLFLNSATSSYDSYFSLTSTPTSSPEVKVSTTTINANTIYSIKNFITASTSPNTSTIDAGSWTFSTYATTSSAVGTTQIVYHVYKHATTAVETLLFSATSSALSTTLTTTPNDTTVIEPDFIIDPTDRITVEYYAVTTSATPHTVSVYYQGNVHFSHINTPIAISHNNLQGLQGGANAEYYHLTLADYSRVIASSSAWRTWNDFSNIATGLTYNSANGQTSWTSGYQGFLTASGTAFQNTTNTVNASSSNWQSTYLIVNASSTKWDTAYFTVNSSSTKWDLAYTNRISTATLPLVIATNTISINKASSTADGYLSSTDWSTFNGKQPAGAYITLSSLSANSPLLYNNSTGAFSLNTDLSLYGNATTTFTTATATRATLSSTATGLTYTSATGVFSLTGGYAIPTTASSGAWNTATLIVNASSTNWDKAYNGLFSNVNTGYVLQWNGSNPVWVATGTLGITGGGAATSSGGGTFQFASTTVSSSTQVTYTIPFSYTVGSNNLDVYVNGVKMTTPDDYTEASSTAITFVSGRRLSDKITFKVSGGATMSTSTSSAVGPWGATTTGNIWYMNGTQSSVGIGTSTFDGTNPEKLKIDASSTTNTGLEVYGKINSFFQTNIINSSNGVSASADVVATNDTGNDTNGYIDMGINSSGYTDNIVGVANDTYLYGTSTGNVLIGSASANGALAFFAGGTNAYSNERMRIASSGNIIIGATTSDSMFSITANALFGSEVFEIYTAAKTILFKVATNGVGFFTDTLSSLINFNGDINIQNQNARIDFGTATGTNSQTLGIQAGTSTLFSVYPSPFNMATSSQMRVASYEPSMIPDTAAANFIAVYSDDVDRMLTTGTAAAGATTLHSGSLSSAATAGNAVYNSANVLQTITATNMVGTANALVKGAITYQGYHYAMAQSSTTATFVIKRATSSWSNDLSIGANWATTTVPNYVFGTGEIGIVGAQNGIIWVASSTTVLRPFTISTSTNTLTAGTPLTITGASMALATTRINENGIYAAFSSAPFVRKYNFAGVQDFTRGGQYQAAPSTTGPDAFVMPFSFYFLAGDHVNKRYGW